MFSTQPNLFIYVSLIFGVLFVCFSLYKSKKLPILTDIFMVILSVAAAFSGIDLCYLVLEGSKGLGDFTDQKLVIVLGGVAVFWVSLLSIINSCKQIKTTQ
ncbi:hypothetical protein HH219_18185 [Pseudoalteromonas sp. NEC-BIFX-2020_015]|uniref:hypothetical protein n=1 Tax=Pseudoalteromonas sp. NEC-BIFX-2020_015 TaxID=2729544 RepID=UPI0014612FD4|nr:hypothetical protein [Pseudoalteromonas sp. NEC-BIFX-2020_015]NMR27441.1 hypothetical protein [Pseudoalteromonas sp. NEC-BIFX-2020_015]